MFRRELLVVLLILGLCGGAAWAATPAATTTTGTDATTTGSAAPTPMAGSATLSASSTKAGARPVALTLTLHYEMQCGQPGKGPLVVGLPAGARLPATLPSGSALLNGKAADATRAGARTIDVTVPPPPQVMCDLIGPGTLKLVLTKAANVGNPKHAGAYSVSARINGRAFTAPLPIGS